MENKSKQMLGFEEVVAGYGEREIIKGFCAEISAGEFVGLIGPNGTGKSTLIKCISGLLPVKSGKIFLQGRDNRSYTYRERAKKIAVVPQSYNVEYDFTVQDIVLMGRNPYLSNRDRESPQDYEIVVDAMRSTNTYEFKDRFYNNLSGGEKQRVIIARAIAQATDVILLDEPTSALDINHQIQVMELIHDLNKNKSITVMAVLHDINLAARYCDRLILINEGKVVADGKPEQVICQESLKKVYNMRMFVHQNLIFKKPEIIPLGESKRIEPKKILRIHVICGGSEATRVLEVLYSRGHQVSAGVINRGSDDWKLCKALGIEMIEVAPFTSVSEKKQEENLALMEDCDIVFISDIPFGEGNINNLKGLEKVKGAIYLHQNCKINDFTDGKVKKSLDVIKNKKNILEIASDEEFLERVSEISERKDRTE